MPIFLGGFLPDGYCTEGSGYWDYGYGHFLDLTAAVAGATGGLVDFSRMPRARRAFLYGAESRLDERHCPPFADGGAWHFEEKPVPNNDRLPIKRLAVVFDRPLAAATVTWRFESIAL